MHLVKGQRKLDTIVCHAVMDAENLIVILGVGALSVVGSLYRFVAASAQLFEALRLLLLENGPLLQKSCKFSC